MFRSHLLKLLDITLQNISHIISRIYSRKIRKKAFFFHLVLHVSPHPWGQAQTLSVLQVDYVLWKITPRIVLGMKQALSSSGYKFTHRKRNPGRKIDFTSQLISLESIPEHKLNPWQCQSNTTVHLPKFKANVISAMKITFLFCFSFRITDIHVGEQTQRISFYITVSMPGNISDTVPKADVENAIR